MTVHTRVVKWASRMPQPWKNGGGTTFQLAADPSGADLTSFDWRVSVAEVAADGPFSTFEGIDRTLVLLEGDGVELVVGDRSTTLSKARPMLSFDGEAATHSHLLSGPVRDLNVMTRRGRASHDVVAPPAGRLAPRSAHWLVFALGWDVTLTIDGTPFRLDRFDLLVAQGRTENATLDGRCWLIELHCEQSS